MLVGIVTSLLAPIEAKDDGFDYENTDQDDGFRDKEGILHSGHEIHKLSTTLPVAKKWCAARKDCNAFTYLGQRDAKQQAWFYFKSTTSGYAPAVSRFDSEG